MAEKKKSFGEKVSEKKQGVPDSKLQTKKTITETETKEIIEKPIAVEKIVENKNDKKTETKSEKKIETKSEKKTETKIIPVEKKKYIPYVKKANKAKSKEAMEIQKKIKGRKWKPVFRGRFGKKNIRRKSIAKWDKWRKPHGIDLDKGLQHGFRPKIGYGNTLALKHVHPSGYMEVMVCNNNDLAKIDSKTQAARLSAVLGKRKRNEIIKKANEKGIWVLN